MQEGERIAAPEVRPIQEARFRRCGLLAITRGSGEATTIRRWDDPSHRGNGTIGLSWSLSSHRSSGANHAYHVLATMSHVLST